MTVKSVALDKPALCIRPVPTEFLPQDYVSKGVAIVPGLRLVSYTFDKKLHTTSTTSTGIGRDGYSVSDRTCLCIV